MHSQSSAISLGIFLKITGKGLIELNPLIMPSFERNNTYGKKKNQTWSSKTKKEKPTLDYSLKQILNHNSLT